MNTKPSYKVEIDFDEASKAWRRNKKKNGGSFKYVCGRPRKSDGEPCQAPPVKWARSRRPKNELFVRDWGPCRFHETEVEKPPTTPTGD